MSQYFENDEKIKSDIRMIKARIGDNLFDLYSDNGVFSKNELDEGSKILIETFFESKKQGKVLDVGGGIGVISIAISKVLGNFCDMVEINERAIKLAKKNVKLNDLSGKINVIKSDVYEAINDTYDVIITNPPIRAGKKVVYRILLDSINYLNDNGELWFVMRKSHGAPSAKRDVEEVFGNCEIVNRDKGFYVLKAIKK